jgi:hypothetical protein
LIPQPGEGDLIGKSVAISGRLLQVFGAPSSDGSFWSIAVEAQLDNAFRSCC